MRLWHWTCDHGKAGIDKDRCLKPGVDGLIWMTDLPPDTKRLRKALGLTSEILTCDRMTYVYEVEVERPIPFRALELHPKLVKALAHAGARPANWYVSRDRVSL